MDNSRFASKKPEIKVYYNGISDIKEIQEVLLGIEEEGIPFNLQEVSGMDATKVGYKASFESPLGVGIGVDAKNIVLHFNKLKEEQPLYKINIKANAANKRSLGANAARLVTKMPFKEIEY